MGTISGRLLCFSHVQKAGGTTVEAVMRRNLGIRHMVVDPRIGWIYRESDLKADLRINPFVQNLCSHWLRPFVRFGEFEDRMVWYTILRDPVERYLSHYQHHIEKMGSTLSFEAWLRQPIQRNWQTQLFAGEQDVEAAKQILSSRYRCVALLERFDESMLLIRERLGLGRMKLAYGQPRNVARSQSTRQRLHERFDQYRDAILENNLLDLELYRHVCEDVFVRQVREYGEERLDRDRVAEFSEYQPSLGDRIRERSNALFRRSVYLPVARARRVAAHRQGIEDIRQ